jgi:glutamate racemase
MSEKNPIGIFDSGIGGLSVLKQIRMLLPGEDILYFADQVHVPYGSRSLDEVRQLSEEITRFLANHDAKLIVLACNTASAASLHYLRAVFPELPFIGMEPAVKPAAERTRSGIVGVLATPATFQGELFASVVDRYAEGIQVLQSTFPGLVEYIESGDLDSVDVKQLLEAGIEPLLELGADTLVLGCTHYPFVLPTIQSISGVEVEVIDPSPAIARRAQQVLKQEQFASEDSQEGHTLYVTTGDASHFGEILSLLQMPRGEIKQVTWQAGRLLESFVDEQENGHP